MSGVEAAVSVGGVDPTSSVVGAGIIEGVSAKKEANRLGRAWRWIQDHPSSTPVVSTFTGVGMVAFYAVTALIASVVLTLGLTISVGSAFVPGFRGSHQWRELSTAVAGAAVGAIGMSTRKFLRGLISTVPVVGNAIIYVADKRNGLTVEQLFNLQQMLPGALPDIHLMKQE